ncbi:MAG: hypothetical protein LBU05_00710 [Bifidobacteriaceae bacterium]|nr:hypothetical protein [Bifidobacteriaceae bacterium]
MTGLTTVTGPAEAAFGTVPVGRAPTGEAPAVDGAAADGRFVTGSPTTTGTDRVVRYDRFDPVTVAPAFG